MGDPSALSGVAVADETGAGVPASSVGMVVPVGLGVDVAGIAVGDGFAVALLAGVGLGAGFAAELLSGPPLTVTAFVWA